LSSRSLQPDLDDSGSLTFRRANLCGQGNSFLAAHVAPFTTNRIWIGGYNPFEQVCLRTSRGLCAPWAWHGNFAHSWDRAGYPALVPRSVRVRSTNTEFALRMDSDGDFDDASDGENPSRHTPSLTVGSEPATEQRADHAQHEGAHDSEAPEANDGVRHALMYEPDPAIHGAE
jgi:hypothetical protein